MTWAMVAVALALAVLLPVRAELRAPVSPQDEGLLLVYPDAILHGATPNQSFESVYGAASLWAVAGAFGAAGHSVVVERLVGLLYQAVLVGSLTILVGRRRGPLPALLAGGLAAVMVASGVGLAASAWIGAIAFACLGICLADMASSLTGKPRGWLCALSGVFLGLAISYRLDIALAVGVFVLAVACLRGGSAASLLPGVLVGVVPLLISAVQAGPAAVIRGQLIQPIFVSGPGRHLPLGALDCSPLIVLSISVVTAVALVASGAAAVKNRDFSSPHDLAVAVGLFDLGLLPQVLQRVDSTHVAYIACFVLGSSLLLPLRAIQAAGLGAAMCLLAAPMTARFELRLVARAVGLRPDPQFVVANRGRSVAVSSAADRSDLHHLLTAIAGQSRSGDRVFVGPQDLRRTNYNDTFLYFLLPNLVPGTFYLEMEPGVANAGSSRLANDLQGDALVVLTSSYDSWREPNASTKIGSSQANEVVASNFHSVGQWGPWRLLRANR